jgi:glutaredoxin
MSKKSLTSIIIGLVVLAAVVFVVFKYVLPPKNLVLFYGNGCPHCQNVDNFIKENKIEEKISLEKKEVFESEENAKELLGAAQKCNLATTEIGVPFLWDGSECFMGETDIINFLKQKAGIPQ